MRVSLVACTLLALCFVAPSINGSPLDFERERHLWHHRLHLSPKKYDLERLREPVYPEVRPAFVKRRRRSPEPESLEEEAAAASIAASVASLPSKSGRSHQFVTAREQKSAHDRPILHELAGETPSPSSPPSVAVPGPVSGRDGPTDVRGAGDMDGSTSRLGTGREALGVRANEIPQGPGYSAVYESETMRHANDHRYFSANAYGGHSGYSHHLSSYPPPPPPPPPPLMGRNPGPTAASTAQPRRIIYYASLPEPPAPSLPYPGAFYPSAATQAGIGARTPHEYRGPFDGATSGRNAGGLPPSLYAFSTSAYPETPYPAPAPSALPVTLAAASEQDYSRYRAPNNLPRYTILDAELPQQYTPYRNPAIFPHPYRSSAAFSGASGLGSTTGPEPQAPLRYTQYDYNGVGARTANSAGLVDAYRSPATASAVASPTVNGPPYPADDLYRGYNPRQPAPWSMQVRANLTVKDDGYGSVGLPPAARRFYVTSQQPPYPQAVSAEARQRYLH